MYKKTAILITLLAGFLIYSGCDNSKAISENSVIVNVRVTPVGLYDVDNAIAFSGTIEAFETVPLSFTVTGRVEKVWVDEGEYVAKGQLLAELDKEIMTNAYEMSSATLERARDAYNRLQPMYENGSLPEIKFIEVETSLQQAKAATAIAEKNLQDCSLNATKSGYIGTRSIDPGMSVLPGVAAISIVDIDKVYARITVSENEIAGVAKGQKCNITVAALGNGQFTGRVDQVGIVANPVSHTYGVKIMIPNTEEQLKPGMICDVALLRPDTGNSVVIPNQAVQVDEKGNTFVYTVNRERNIALRKYITTGGLTRKGIQVDKGLDQGDYIVVAGQQKLADKSMVNIIN